MRIHFALVFFSLALSACGEDPEVVRKRNEDRLPPGCKIIDLDYGDLRAAVVCDGRKSTTSLRSWDETIYVYDVNLKMTMPQIQHHRFISVEIN